MTAKLYAPRGADLLLRYVFPDTVVLDEYTAAFTVYSEPNGAPLLVVTQDINPDNSVVTFDGNSATVLVRAADIDDLPEDGTDSTSPAILSFDFIVTSSTDFASKIHGGVFIVQPFGSSVSANGQEVSVNFNGTDINVTLEGNSLAVDGFDALLAAETQRATNAEGAIQSDLNVHKINTSNPHGTTAAQVGAYTSSQTDTLLAAKASLAALAANTGGTLVGWLQSGVGTVNQTVQKKLQELVSIADFGAIGDGATDATAAFNAAHVEARAKNTGVYIPPSGAGFVVAGTIVAKAPMYGSGYNSLIITSSVNADVITVDEPGVKLSNFRIDANVTRTGGTYIRASTASYFTAEFLYLFNSHVAIVIDGPAEGVTRVDNCIIVTSVTSQNLIIVTSTGAGLSVDVVIENVLLQCIGGGNCANGIVVLNVGDMQIEHVNTLNCGNGLAVSPGSGERVQYLVVNNSLFDTGSGVSGKGVIVAPSGTGSVDCVEITNCWSATNDYGYIFGQGGGLIKRIIMINCVGSGNVNHGAAFTSSNLGEILIMGGTFAQNTHGLFFDTNVSNFKVIGVTAAPTGQFTANTGYNIYLAGGNDNFNIESSDFRSGGTGNYNITPSGSGIPGQTYFIRGNQGLITANASATTLNSAAMTTVVSHGLATTPRNQDIRLTPLSGWGTMAKWWVSNITSTQFTINTDANPGGGVIMGWDARAWGA